MPDNLNLMPERGPNVWDKARESSGEHVPTGVAVGGAVMLAAGAAAAVFGGRMLYRAMKDARQAAPGSGRENRSPSSSLRDVVNEESAESFPASDAPSWTASDGATLDTRHR